MPAFHSSFETQLQTGNIGIFPLRTKVRGPAPPTQEYDIIDEAIDLFRANCFFKNFEIMGNGDRVLVYLTVFIQGTLLLRYITLEECLLRISAGKHQDLKTGWNFSLPGEAGFPLNALYDSPGRDADNMKNYLSQLRQECATRMLDIVFKGQATPSKWWVCFAKRRFMGITSISGN